MSQQFFRKIRFLFLLGVFTLASCGIYEDTGTCSGTLTLRFTYSWNGQELLREKISHVTLYLFDESGLFRESFTVPAEEYARNAVKLRMPSGKYTLVAVGNETEGLKQVPGKPQKGVTRLQDFSIERRSDSHKAPLYMAREEITIPPFAVEAQVPVTFRKKYLSLDVYLLKPQGFSGELSLEIQDSYSRVGFDGKASGSKDPIHSVGTVQPDGTILFSADVFGSEDEIAEVDIVLRDEKGTEVHRLPLLDYLKDKGITPDVTTEKPLALVMMWNKEKTIWVGITIAEWNIIKVTPIL